MTLTRKLLAPGWYRAALGTAGGFAFGMAIVVVVRSLYGWDPVVDWNAIITVGALVLPPMILGMTEASTTRSPSTPRTRSSRSTTESASSPIRQVPTGW